MNLSLHHLDLHDIIITVGNLLIHVSSLYNVEADHELAGIVTMIDALGMMTAVDEAVVAVLTTMKVVPYQSMAHQPAPNTVSLLRTCRPE